MSALGTICTAILTAIVAAIVGGLVGVACVEWYHISGFEGGSGYFVAAIGLMSGFAGLIAGVMTARIVGAGTLAGFGKSLGISCGAMLVLAGGAAAVSRLLADVPPRLNGHLLNLAVEVRMPVGEPDPSPAKEKSRDELTLGSINPLTHVQRASEDGVLRVGEAKKVDGRWVIPGSVLIFTSRGDRAIAIVMDGKSRGGFIVPLPAHPGGQFAQWSEWLPSQRGPGQPWPDNEISYRFRVEEQIPAPPAPDPEIARTAEFNALAPDAPLEKWLAFMREDMPAERRAAVLQKAQERPTELAALIRSKDENTAETAMNALMSLKTIDPAVVQAMRDVGEDIAADIRRFNDMKPDDPSAMELAWRARTRFGTWHRAWWTVHQNSGIDGRPLIEEILALAKVHPENVHMDEVIVNGEAHLNGIPKAPEKAK
jgi:hypothetical protein